MRAHGTRACYVFGPQPGQDRSLGCRCEPCKNANRAYARDRLRAQSRPDEALAPAYVSAAPARDHLRWLQERGVGLRTVADVSGVGRSSLQQIASGRRTKATPQVIERILAVKAVPRGTSLVDAAPTWQLIDRLLAAGWTRAAIAGEIGQDGRRLQLQTDRVTAENARRVADLAARVLTDDEGERDAVEGDDIDELYLAMAEVLEDRQAEWRRRAACSSPKVPSRIFFPGRGESTDVACAVCLSCPVAAECAAYAMERGASRLPGVWGATSGRDRRHLAAVAS